MSSLKWQKACTGIAQVFPKISNCDHDFIAFKIQCPRILRQHLCIILLEF